MSSFKLKVVCYNVLFAWLSVFKLSVDMVTEVWVKKKKVLSKEFDHFKFVFISVTYNWCEKWVLIITH